MRHGVESWSGRDPDLHPGVRHLHRDDQAAANVVAGATASQQLAAGELAEVIAAIRAGAAYANVHTNLSPGGEIRGQIRGIANRSTTAGVAN